VREEGGLSRLYTCPAAHARSRFAHDGERPWALRHDGPGPRRPGGDAPAARGGSRAAGAAAARVSRGWSPDTADRSPPATPAPRGGAGGHRPCAPDRQAIDGWMAARKTSLASRMADRGLAL